MTTTAVYARRYLTDYARNPTNLLLLVLVPVVFVVVVAGSMADAAKLLGGQGGPAVETASAGWAAAFLAGIAMYFQTAATRATDRRLVIAGLSANRLVLARMLTGFTLATGAAAAALFALAARTGINSPLRIAAGTLMFAVIYIGIGAIVGSLARNPVNGTVVVLFVWIMDVFFGPAMGAADRIATRWLPTHFVTLWMLDEPSGHGGRLGDLGLALAWTAAAAGAAWLVVSARTRTRPLLSPRRRSRLVSRQLTGATQTVWRDARRNPAQWVLFVLVPAVFILTAVAVTPDKPIILGLREHSRDIRAAFSMPSVHGATMAPIAVASLAALVGLFTMLDSRAGDHRVVHAGLRPRTLLTARLTVLAAITLVATAVSMVTTAVVFDARRWPVYVAANLLIGFTYALIGALLAPIFGRVSGVFMAFLLPFIDLGVVQSPMLHTTPTALAHLLPGYGGSRVLLDAALTRGFDEATPLLISLAWLVALCTVVAVTYRRAVARYAGQAAMQPMG